MLMAGNQPALERERVVQRERLYAEISCRVAPCLARVEELLGDLPDDEEDFVRTMRRAAVGATYLKRCANLMLVGEAGTVDACDLALVLEESREAFARSGVVVEPPALYEDVLPTSEAVAVYDAYHAAGEAALDARYAACGGSCAKAPRRQAPQVERRPTVEAVARDVSDGCAMAGEAAKRDIPREPVNQQRCDHGAGLARSIREEEALAAKVRVHDELGRALVALRAYERQAPAARDRAALVSLWRTVTTVLQPPVPAGEDERADAWGLLQEAAAAVDVRLTLEGALPQEPRLRELAIALVHECLTNAVRHGEAREVHVKAVDDDASVTLRITNDGTSPTTPPAETGGLADLRRMVEAAHGTMRLECEPCFAVVTRLARGEGLDGRYRQGR